MGIWEETWLAVDDNVIKRRMGENTHKVKYRTVQVHLHNDRESIQWNERMLEIQEWRGQ